MGRSTWDANIETSRESNSQTLSEAGYDGNREYENGTYGQSDYTVRDRGDGTSDVYVFSDSEKEHSHDLIDNSTGDLLESYHDYLLSLKEMKELNQTLTYSMVNKELILEKKLK
jgi:hypothetical protein